MMKSEQRSQAFLRKRKMMLMIPLLVIPFLTFAFWVLGGGRGGTETKQKESQGLILELPDPKLKADGFENKLSFYEKAEKDSAKLAEWKQADPYYQNKQISPGPFQNELEQATHATASRYGQGLSMRDFDKGNSRPEEEVMHKLALLQQEMDKKPAKDTGSISESDGKLPGRPEISGEIDRLENMMELMRKDSAEDPEMKQLSAVMDKILDIQHPARLKDRMKATQEPQVMKFYGVSGDAPDDTAVKGFYELKKDSNEKDQSSIEAVVDDNQVLVDGAIIKLRLLQDIFVGANKIPAGNCIFGFVTINGERLEIQINSIRNKTSLFPVKMEVYDMDGLPGIYIPGAITRDVFKQSADNSLQLMEMTSLDPSLKAQATAAGVSSLKNLLSKKIKQVKVMVKAGYRVLLKDKSNQQ